MNIKRVFSALTAAVILSCTFSPSAVPAVYDTVHAESEDLTFNVNMENNQFRGTTDDGFLYDVWVEKVKDATGSATLRKDGSMSLDWNTQVSTGYFIYQYGLDYETGTDPLEQGEICVDYDVDYSVGENGNSQLGVHGWLGPRDQFYIIDDWVNWKPSSLNCTGDLLPGTEYRRYYSVRKEPRKSGTITVSDHFKSWAELGWKIEDLRDITFDVEGWESEGSVEIKKLNFNVSPDGDTPTDTTSKTYTVDNDNNHKEGITDDGFSYDVMLDYQYKPSRDTNGSMTINDDGTLNIEWDAIDTSLWFEADYGRKYPPQTKVMEQDYISIDYVADYSASSTGNSRFGVHGWLTDPIVEYYIIDDWTGWRPSDREMETVVIDGAEYDVFKLDHITADIISTDVKRVQHYFSVRKNPRTSGTINVSEHFKAWESLGWDMGNLLNVNFNVGGWESSGKFDVKKLDFTFSRPDDTIPDGTEVYTVDKTDNHKRGTDSNGFLYDVSIDTWDKENSSEKASLAVGNDNSLNVKWESYTPNTWFYSDYGYEYSSGIKAMDLGPISVDYDAEHSSKPMNNNGNSRLGVHGWLKDPLVEYYIIDNWIDWRPSDDKSETFVIDGGEYDVFKLVHYSGDIMSSGASFTQYFSIRKDKRTSGTITVSDHFKAWESLGWEIGGLYSVCLNVEGWESAGSAEIKNFKINAPIPGAENAEASTTIEQPSVIIGDFNNDKVIDSLDLVRAKAALIEWSDDKTPSEYMDLNQDNAFDIADVVMLKSFLLGKIKSFDKAEDNK